jgi:hypothetical protein|mmetsp:Transcript_5826/g.17536  ORF Transcript_5826/g.17536 Transcript_5826/m.17536 type:complete len:83 (-) Transcript_5826:177-425(-)
MFAASARRAVPRLARGLKTSAPAGGAPPGYKYDYLHGPHMYDLSQMSNRKLKWGLASAGILVAGFGIPIWAVRFSNQKAGVW